MSIIEIACPFCGRIHTVSAHASDYYAWQDGMLAQQAFPYLSATEREQLISGMCPECQRSVFGEDE